MQLQGLIELEGQADRMLGRKTFHKQSFTSIISTLEAIIENVICCLNLACFALGDTGFGAHTLQ